MPDSVSGTAVMTIEERLTLLEAENSYLKEKAIEDHA